MASANKLELRKPEFCAVDGAGQAGGDALDSARTMWPHAGPQWSTVIGMRILTLLPWLAVLPPLFAAEPLSISTFSVDATPPLGAPLEMGACKPALEIVDRLSARGIVLRNAGAPIVLVAVDWVGIANGGQQEWRAALAKAAGTTPD